MDLELRVFFSLIFDTIFKAMGNKIQTSRDYIKAARLDIYLDDVRQVFEQRKFVERYSEYD